MHGPYVPCETQGPVFESDSRLISRLPSTWPFQYLYTVPFLIFIFTLALLFLLTSSPSFSLSLPTIPGAAYRATGFPCSASRAVCGYCISQVFLHSGVTLFHSPAQGITPFEKTLWYNYQAFCHVHSPNIILHALHLLPIIQANANHKVIYNCLPQTYIGVSPVNQKKTEILLFLMM